VEALARYVLRPPVGQERVKQGPGGLVRLELKKAWSDGTVAVDMDPLSLLCRLAAAVPPPRFHTVRYAGVLAPASPWRRLLVPSGAQDEATGRDPPGQEPEQEEPRPLRSSGHYRCWAHLLARTFAVDVLHCADCGGRMKLIALIEEPEQIARCLRGMGEPAEPPARSPPRGPPYWRSQVLRRRAGTTSEARAHA